MIFEHRVYSRCQQLGLLWLTIISPFMNYLRTNLRNFKFISAGLNYDLFVLNLLWSESAWRFESLTTANRILGVYYDKRQKFCIDTRICLGGMLIIKSKARPLKHAERKRVTFLFRWRSKFYLYSTVRQRLLGKSIYNHTLKQSPVVDNDESYLTGFS